jgi:hypothetical protein
MLAVAVILGSIVSAAWPVTHATEPWLAGTWMLLMIGAVVGFFANVFAIRRRRGQLSVNPADPSFMVGLWHLYQVRLLAWALVILVGPSIRLTSVDPVLVKEAVALAVIFVALIVLTCLALLTNRPRVELYPQLLRIQGMFARYDVPWEALAVTGYTPAVWSPARFQIHQPELVERGGPSRRRPRTIVVPTATVYSPAGLTALVDYYVTHPDARAAIGTPDELSLLQLAGLA